MKFAIHFLWTASFLSAAQAKTFSFLGVAGGTIEESCYSPRNVNTVRETMRETTRQLCLRAAKQQVTAGECKPRRPSRLLAVAIGIQQRKRVRAQL